MSDKPVSWRDNSNPMVADGGCFMFLAGVALIIAAFGLCGLFIAIGAHINAVCK